MRELFVILFISTLSILGLWLLSLIFDNGEQQSSTDDIIYNENYELENCLESYKSALEEYKVAVFDAQYALDGIGDGDSYEDLVEAIDGANEALGMGDQTPYCN